MPTWAWVLCILLALAGLLALLLFLIRVRYRLEWRAEWTGASLNQDSEIVIGYGVPGIMREWRPDYKTTWNLGRFFDDDDDLGEPKEAKNDEEKASEETTEAENEDGGGFGEAAPEEIDSTESVTASTRQPPAFLSPAVEGGSRVSAPPGVPLDTATKSKSNPRDPNRKRRAMFRFATDRDVWKFLSRYGARSVRLLFGLLGPRLEIAAGGPDPVRLGRFAAKWHTVRPFLPGDPVMRFRFQDRNPSLWIRVEGGFSALAALTFGARLLLAFPLVRLGFRALHGWRQHRLKGWRAWVYRRIQKIR